MSNQTNELDALIQKKERRLQGLEKAIEQKEKTNKKLNEKLAKAARSMSSHSDGYQWVISESDMSAETLEFSADLLRSSMDTLETVYNQTLRKLTILSEQIDKRHKLVREFSETVEATEKRVLSIMESMESLNRFHELLEQMEKSGELAKIRGITHAFKEQ